jgi:hypothetical protein
MSLRLTSVTQAKFVKGREILADISALKYVLEVFFLFSINFALYTRCSTLSSFRHLASYRRISREVNGSRKRTFRFFQPNAPSLFQLDWINEGSL